MQREQSDLLRTGRNRYRRFGKALFSPEMVVPSTPASSNPRTSFTASLREHAG